MGTTLTGTTPQDTYDSLIKVTDNGPLSGSLKVLTDGLGNNSTLSLSTAAASIAGTLAVTGNVTFDTTTMFVDAAANRVGILTASPTEPLHVEGNIMLAYGSSLKAANATYKTLIETGYNGTSDFVSLYSAGNNIGNATAKITMLAGGNVGIGTTAPTEPLHVVGDARVTNLGVNFAAQADARIFVYDDSANSGLVIQQDGASGIIAKFNGSGGATKVRIDADGLKFGADTAAANALDDYEEGTWTMGISFGGASVGVTTSANTGTYTKIGRQVTLNGYLELSSKGSSTGVAKITGLPFAIPNTGANYSAPALWFSKITFANQFQGLGTVGASVIELYETTVLGTTTSLTDADFANDSNLILSFTYFV